MDAAYLQHTEAIKARKEAEEAEAIASDALEVGRRLIIMTDDDAHDEGVCPTRVPTVAALTCVSPQLQLLLVRQATYGCLHTRLLVTDLHCPDALGQAALREVESQERDHDPTQLRAR